MTASPFPMMAVTMTICPILRIHWWNKRAVFDRLQVAPHEVFRTEGTLLVKIRTACHEAKHASVAVHVMAARHSWNSYVSQADAAVTPHFVRLFLNNDPFYAIPMHRYIGIEEPFVERICMRIDEVFIVSLAQKLLPESRWSLCSTFHRANLDRRSVGRLCPWLPCSFLFVTTTEPHDRTRQ